MIAAIAQTAGLDAPTTAHVLRHTLATTLDRGKIDLVLVAEIRGMTSIRTKSPVNGAEFSGLP
ncbi:tyrosine-type recombinase/integrase [Nonomuraea sp. NPDC005983]|uniref:tyrosine-type recombinase/integrase n=1 Tax=Nonomuraea sp. NPDC005983 TaxID=3155595 RepID=UPI0033A470D7